MPKENYGRKGLSRKPNTNAEGVVDEAADPVDAEAIAPTNAEVQRVVDAPENEAATQRPNTQKQQQSS
jgi:hypothetical protein